MRAEDDMTNYLDCRACEAAFLDGVTFGAVARTAKDIPTFTAQRHLDLWMSVHHRRGHDDAE